MEYLKVMVKVMLSFFRGLGLKVFLFLSVIFFEENVVGQTYNIATENGTIINTCSGFFTDPGGSSADYGDNEEYTVTFCSDNGENLAFDFMDNGATELELALGDTLLIYEGVGVTGRLIDILESTDNESSSNFSSNKEYSPVFTSTCVTFVFKSNASGVDEGWNAEISCVSPMVGCNGNNPPSDLMGQAPGICNLDGYCGVTNSAYSSDLPFDMGQGGNCPSANAFLGTVENNSWLSFTASSASVSLDFAVTNCAIGVQVAILKPDAFGNMVRYSDCSLSDGSHLGTFTLSGTGLTPGDEYYLMIDGNGGDVCDYVITADPLSIAVVSAGENVSICAGSDTVLTATGPPSAIYTWTSTDPSFSPATQVATSITVNPSVTATYTVEVTGGGICESQTADVTVTLTPCVSCSISIASGNQTVCDPLTNTYTQEVVVTYSDEPSSGTLDVNGQSFAIGTSPQTVTLVGLVADGSDVDVNAAFSADAGCTITTVGLFTAPVNCSPCLISRLTAGVRSVCDAKALTYEQEVIVTYSNEPSTGDLTVNGQTFSITSSPQTVTLTGLVVDGNAVDVTAQFTADLACTATTVSLFESEIVSEPVFSSIDCINELEELPTTSSNGIEGVWSVKSVAEPTVFIFTPDGGFCADSVSLTIPFCAEVLIPNVFTPNGDGENDGFTITSDKLVALDVVIYNRWGQVVFSWSSLKGSWDGRTTAGLEAPEGTYFYIAKTLEVGGEETTLKGTFSLIR